MSACWRTWLAAAELIELMASIRRVSPELDDRTSAIVLATSRLRRDFKESPCLDTRAQVKRCSSARLLAEYENSDTIWCTSVLLPVRAATISLLWKNSQRSLGSVVLTDC